MSKALFLQFGVKDDALQHIETRLAALNIAVNWQALWDFIQLAVTKKGGLTLDDISAALKAILGLDLPQCYGYLGGEYNQFSIVALLKLITDIQAGASITVIIADILALLTK